jgi:hypothetical protein
MSETDNVTDVVNPAVEDHEMKSAKDNLIALRRKSELLEQQNLLLQQQLHNHAQANGVKAKQLEPEEQFDFSQLETEEFPDGKKLSKAFSVLDRKLKAYDTKLSEKDRKIAVLEAAVNHKDFNEIVTAENVKKYIESDEDNLESVRTAANPGLKIYNLIKKSHAYQQDQLSKKSVASQEKQKVEEKETKPKTSSIGVRSEAVGIAAAISNSKMTREQRNALWAETQSAARR